MSGKPTNIQKWWRSKESLASLQNIELAFLWNGSLRDADLAMPAGLSQVETF
jgi:hypothetical protein